MWGVMWGIMYWSVENKSKSNQGPDDFDCEPHTSHNYGKNSAFFCWFLIIGRN